MKIKALTPAQVAKKSLEMGKVGNDDIDLVVNEINRQLIFHHRNNPTNPTITVGGEGYRDNIRYPDNDGMKQSIPTINRALRSFEKHWDIKLVGEWNSLHSRLEFTAKKQVKP